MEYKQKPTKEGLEAELQAKKDAQAVIDYKRAMRNFINPARQALGMPVKKY